MNEDLESRVGRALGAMHIQFDGQVDRVREADQARALKIWGDFKWELKKPGQTYSTIQLLLEQAVERCGRELKLRSIREPVTEKFRVMLIRIGPLVVEGPADEAEICAGCENVKIFCTCPPKEY